LRQSAAGVATDVQRIQMYLDDAGRRKGGGAASYREKMAAHRSRRHCHPRGAGAWRGSRTVWTRDFSYDYVKINASYRS
jgi:glutamate N-acetyltransferase/amino-acid N-acetyltransferase